MRIALLGRTEALLISGRVLVDAGHEIPVVATSRAEPFYRTDENDFAQFAESCGAELVRFPSTPLNELKRKITDARCDIAVSMNWISVFNTEFLAALPHGILNAHPGDLPRYRGNACPNWAILNNETHIGLCIHVMVPELDSGPVVLRDNFSLSDKTYIGDVYHWILETTPRLFLDAVEGLADGSISPVPQAEDPAKALRCFPRRPEDSRIDWSRSSDEIHRLVRASSRPFSGAFTTLEGTRKVVVWRAVPHHYPSPFSAVPGQVCLRHGNNPVIACGDGMLELSDVEIEGIEKTAESKKAIHRSLRNRLI